MITIMRSHHLDLVESQAGRHRFLGGVRRAGQQHRPDDQQQAPTSREPVLHGPFPNSVPLASIAVGPLARILSEISYLLSGENFRLLTPSESSIFALLAKHGLLD